MVNFIVEDNDGNRQPVEAPDDMGFSLMEILKASDYPVLATCGGMALCATCHVEILEGKDGLGDATDAELDLNQKFVYNSELFNAQSQKDLTELLKQSISIDSFSLMPINIGIQNQTIKISKERHQRRNIHK